MKKIIMFIVVLSMLFGTCCLSVSAKSNTFTISQISGKYKTQGRTELVDDVLYLDWSASGIEFNANCSGEVSIEVNTTRINSATNGGIYFTVIIDGVVQCQSMRAPSDNNASNWTSNSTNYPFKIEKTGVSKFVIAKNLKAGEHKFEIYNQTEALDGSFGIKSITLDGEITGSKNNNDLYVEFVGDSITAGLGNLSVGGQRAPLYQDATQGWAYLTAKKLNADWSIIAQSGITASNSVGWQGVNSVSMQTVYTKWRYFSDNSKAYNFNRAADVVVICLGTNDIRTYLDCGKTIEYLKSEFKEMIKVVQKYNPNTKVVWLYGMMTSDADSLIKSAVTELGGAEKGLYTLALQKNVSGGQGHPNLAVQPTYASTVTSFIKEILNIKDENNESSQGGVQSKPSSSSSASSKNESQIKPGNSSNSEDDNKTQNGMSGSVNSKVDSSNQSDNNESDLGEGTVSSNISSKDKEGSNDTDVNVSKEKKNAGIIIPIIIFVVAVVFACVNILLFRSMKKK